MSKVVQAHFHEGTDYENFARHYAWMTILASYVSEDAARVVAAAHEYRIIDNGNLRQRMDSKRDFLNNEIAFRDFRRTGGVPEDVSLFDNLNFLGILASARWRDGYGVRMTRQWVAENAD